MRILLTNDDGIFAPGIAAIYKSLAKIGDVTVVAPLSVRSGASHSITLEPVACEKIDITGKFIGYGVDGSPADCVKIAIMRLFANNPFDLVVSGINHGANVGIHLHYSGTVSAAMEGAFNGIPAIAVSSILDAKMDMDKVASCAMGVIEKLLPITKPAVFNINIPQLSGSEPKGVKIVGHSMKGFDEKYVTIKDEKGRDAFQYTSGKPHDSKDADIDTRALLDGFITITPLRLDMNNPSGQEKLENIQW
jgi:5'-nucleotidase